VPRGNAEVDKDEWRPRYSADEEVSGLDVAVDGPEAVQAADDAQQSGNETFSSIIRS
jgi:hypothetical protein